MDFNRLYNYVVGNEIEDYRKAQGELNLLKQLNTQLNPNNRYRVVQKEGPGGTPIYYLFNIDLDDIVAQFKFQDLKLLNRYANQNNINLEPFQPQGAETCAGPGGRYGKQQIVIEPEE